MRRHRLSVCLLLAVLIPAVGSQAAEKTKILFVTQSKGFVHSSVKRGKTLAPAEVALVQLGEQSGEFEVDCTQDCEADFTRENLQKYDIVAFYTTGDLPISEETLNYFFHDWLTKPGHGVLGFHSAMDTFKKYEPYWDMIGGSFIAHPWTSKTQVTLTNLEPENPLTSAFGKEYVLDEEIYMYEHWQPAKVHLLMTLDYAKSPVKNPVPIQHGYLVPVCWIKNYGQGRVYCNNLGHNETTWTKKPFLDSITAAVKWIRGDFDVDATPNPQVSATQAAKAEADFKAGDFKVKDADEGKDAKTAKDANVKGSKDAKDANVKDAKK
jgi:type 1 glutamine amidotransferase